MTNGEAIRTAEEHVRQLKELDDASECELKPSRAIEALERLIRIAKAAK